MIHQDFKKLLCKLKYLQRITDFLPSWIKVYLFFFFVLNYSVRARIVHDSWFSPNYHSLSQTAKEFSSWLLTIVIVHRQSLEKLLVLSPAHFSCDISVVVIIWKNVPKRQDRASYSSIRRKISGHYSISAHRIAHLSRWMFRDTRLCFAASLLILASWRFLWKLSFLCHLGLQYFLCQDYHLEYKHDFLQLSLARTVSRLFQTSLPIFGENSWSKTIMTVIDYHEEFE